MRSHRQPLRLIHFFGPDGSGKSTQVEILINLLRSQGVDARKCWVRAHHTIAYILWRLFVKIGFYREVRNAFGVATKIPAVNRNKLLGFFWSIAELIGVFPHLLKVYYYLWRGRTLVAERFILDTITTIAYFLDDLNFLKSCFSRLLMRLIPNDTVFIFLDADYEIIFNRRAPLYKMRQQNLKVRRKEYGAIPDSSVEPMIFINFQRIAYRNLSKLFDTLYIDTSQNSIEQTSKIILKHLGLL